MWGKDLAHVLEDNLTDDRIQSVTRYRDLPSPPKPEGVRVVDTDGRVWDFQIVTTAPPSGGEHQTGW